VRAREFSQDQIVINRPS